MLRVLRTSARCLLTHNIHWLLLPMATVPLKSHLARRSLVLIRWPLEFPKGHRERGVSRGGIEANASRAMWPD